QAVDATAPSQCYQPRKWTPALFVEVFRFSPNLQKNLLQDVFRFLAVIQYTHQESKQDYAVAIVELCEGRLIPRGNRLQQFHVVFLCSFWLQAENIRGERQKRIEEI